MKRLIVGIISILFAIAGQYVSITYASIFDVTLGLDLYGTYDDNFLLQSDEEIEASNEDSNDRILQVNPFIQILHERARSFVRFRYSFFREWYDIHHDITRTDNSFQNADLLASWDTTDKITLGLYDTYTDSLYGLEREEIPEVRGDYLTNRLEPSISFHDSAGKRYNLTLKLHWSVMDYDLPAVIYQEGWPGYEDWDELGLNMTGYIALLSRTKLVFGGILNSRDYDNKCPHCTSDYDEYNLLGGIKQELGETITVEGWVEFNHREYDTLTASMLKTTHNNFGGRLLFTDKFSSVSELKIRLFSDFISSERYSSDFYRDTGVEGTLNLNLTNRIEFSTFLRVSRLDYKNFIEDVTNDYMKAGVTVGYKTTDWLSIRARYQYAKRDSDYDDNDDFEDNLFSIYLHFHYDLFR